MKKLLLLIESDSCTREQQLSWPEKHLGAVVEHYGTSNADFYIVSAVARHKPDVVAYSGTLGEGHPSIHTLAWIKSQCRSVFIGWDAGSPDWQPVLKEYRDKKVFDLTIAAEGSVDAWCDVAFVNPYNPELWGGIGPERNIELGFWGGISPDENPRNRLMRQVADFVTIRHKGNPPSLYPFYISFVKRCWATLNSAWQGNPTCGYARHVKGRCIEAALGGSALFEAKGSPLAHWFEPGVDYFEFDEERPRDILDVVQSRGYHDMCTLMSMRMLQKVKDKYHPSKFWQAVIGE